MDKDLNTKIQHWLNRDTDPVTKNQILKLLNDKNFSELKDIFSSRLTFGTAGIRGIIGAGTNRINQLLIQETALGLANYLRHSEENKSVVVGYDERHFSKQFAEATACILISQNIKLHLFAFSCPTPVVSYFVNYYKADAGIVITASHNPKEYNGLKLFFSNGAQIFPPIDSEISEEIMKATQQKIPSLCITDSKFKKEISHIPQEKIKEYIKDISHDTNYSIGKNIPKVKFSYSPLHGVGLPTTDLLMKYNNYKNYYIVKEQSQPNPDFPTVNNPNPEDLDSMKLAIKYAEQNKCDLACVHDPDADRLSIAINTGSNFLVLNGNQIGVLLADYVLSKNKKAHPIVGTTIVSSRMLNQIAINYDATYYETLTGFKWLMNSALLDNHNLIFAYEEAIGYSVNNKVNDKDGMSAMLAFCNLASELKYKGINVIQHLASLYVKYGYYFTSQKIIHLNSENLDFMQKIRAKPIKKIGDTLISSIEDYLSGKIISLTDHQSEQKIQLPSSDILIYNLLDSSRIIIRPSGTEPKIKIYYEILLKLNHVDEFETISKIGKSKIKELEQFHLDEIKR